MSRKRIAMVSVIMLILLSQQILAQDFHLGIIEAIRGTIDEFKEYAPDSPSGLQAMAVSSSQVDLAWWDNSDNEDGFKVYRTFGGTTYSEIADVDPNTTSYSDTSVEPESAYWYYVTAYNSFGSASSNSASATTPSAETGVTGIAYYSTTPLSGVELYLSPFPSGSKIPSTTVYTGQDGRYKILYDTPGKYWLHCLSPSPEYTGMGRSVQIEAGEMTLQDSYLAKDLKLTYPSDGATINDPMPKFTWEANSEAATYYLRISLASTGEIVLEASNIADTSYTFEDPLSEGVRFVWWCQAYDTYGHPVATPFEGNSSFTINSPPSEPGNPSPSDGSTGLNADVVLSWTGGDPDSGDTVTYDVYLEANDSTPDELVSDDQLGTAYDTVWLSFGMHYYWQIVATDNHGASTSGPVWDFTIEWQP